ncbi:hypothetical protein [Rhodococcus sp. HNM0569]|uniref:hypothetical protein n=1 Tax=Rhodococcus sp. HNM0569 TaxID=2716340 RepID=UPI00146D36BB|nr:hypothetical protein [Rhodococcus sp. HNM0569]NLU83621.1 hypothetical protein [Rhodococcus sp. HNM0569]
MMSERSLEAIFPMVENGDRTVVFMPSPNGCYVRVMWAVTHEPVGSFPSIESAVAAGFAAVGATVDDELIAAETARVRRAFASGDADMWG